MELLKEMHKRNKVIPQSKAKGVGLLAKTSTDDGQADMRFVAWSCPMIHKPETSPLQKYYSEYSGVYYSQSRCTPSVWGLQHQRIIGFSL